MNLIEVFEDTRNKSYNVFGQHTRRLLNRDTEVYMGNLSLNKVSSKHPKIEMIQGGTVSTAYVIAKTNTVAIHNFADALEPGGMVTCGSSAQEENICRCKNLYESLTSDKARVGYYRVNQNSERDGRYTDNIVYSKNVAVFKDDKTYEDVDLGFVDVITCPSPSANLEDDEALEIYLKRIEQIVLSAVYGGVDVVVLGAWGCGCFGQNPYLVARAFGEVLNKYAGYFQRVVFAIRPMPTLSGKTIADGMFGVFKQVLTDVYDGEVIDNG